MKRWPVLLLCLLLLLGVFTGSLLWFQRKPLDDALRRAVRTGDQPTVRTLLAKGANPNARMDLELTVTEWAITHKWDLAGALMEHGGRLDRNQHLLIALKSGDYGALMVLLEHDADPETRDEKGRTPLILAGDEPTIKLLLEHGANPNTADAQGRTPLMLYAHGEYNAALLQALLKGGANPHLKDHAGRTAEDYALKANQASNAEIIRKAAARHASAATSSE